jgi:hypothetical protein
VLVRLPVSPTFRVASDSELVEPAPRKIRGREVRQPSLPGI